MKVFGKESIAGNLFVHPGENNPDYVSYVNLFHYSPDGRAASGYREAPRGWLEYTPSGFQELDYVIEGEVEITNLRSGQKATARSGDAYLIQDGDTVRWEMKQLTRTLFFLYPLNDQVREMIAGWKRAEATRR